MFQPSHKVKAVDTTGAGDTYLGYILLAIIDGAASRQAMALRKQSGIYAGHTSWHSRCHTST